jgi:L-asparaginase
MAEDKIFVISTGGTIDSQFAPAKASIVTRKKSMIPVYMQTLQLHDTVKFLTVCMKDSRILTETNRRNIVSAIEKSDCKKVIITHGTYTMVKTAEYLKKNLKKKNMTIVLTGSMIPVEGFVDSDAPFSLGYALSSVQKLKNGIYICMNGRVFDPEKVRKNISEGRFEEK